MRTQPNKDDDVDDDDDVEQRNDKTRKLRNIIFKNNKKVSVAAAITVDGKTKNIRAVVETTNSKNRMKNHRWNKFQYTVNKMIKQSVKDMETIHRTQPQHCIGPFFVGQYSSPNSSY
jgi:hypothetical protein